MHEIENIKLMRLGQLARKLALRPSDIVQFLAERNITIEEGTNTKIDDHQVSIIIQQFAPGMQEPMISEESDHEEPPTVSASFVHDDKALENKPLVAELPPGTPDEPVEKLDVIKAPKVELSGLKVLGKIDLPEERKKPPEISDENMVKEPVPAIVPGRKNSGLRKEPRSHRTSKNPIAYEREREALEANKKREAEAEAQKERRTQNYLKKIKTVQPTKATKIIREETEQMSAAELAEPPKTLWGKLIKWLTT